MPPRGARTTVGVMARRSWIARVDEVVAAALPAVLAHRATRTAAEVQARAAEDAVALARERVNAVAAARRRREVGQAELDRAHHDLAVALDRWHRTHAELA